MSNSITSAIVSISIGIVVAGEVNQEPVQSTEVSESMQGVVHEYAEPHEGEIYVDGYGWIRLEYSEPYQIMDGHLTRSNGSIKCFGHRETWYSTREAAGVRTAWTIPGKHEADDGTIRDKDGYICVASSDLPFYTILMTSVGPAKVYDTGCSRGIIDVYTTW